jgi:hypothetical protein
MNTSKLLSLAAVGVLAGTSAATSARAGLTEPLSAQDISRVASRHFAEVRDCYIKHVYEQKAASGRVLVKAVVRKDGRVTEVVTEAPGVRGKQFARCVERAVKAWQFPESNGATEIQYPYYFQRTRARGAGPKYQGSSRRKRSS